MKLFSGIIIGVLICSIVAMVYYLYANYQIAPRNVSMVETTITIMPTQAISPVEPTKEITKAASVTTAQATSTKTISGSLGYPSSFVPGLKICLYEYTGPGMVEGPKYCTETKDNDMSYQMIGTILPAKYVVFAWVQDADVGADLAGSYTPAVACGLSVECKDHTPTVLDLSAKNSITGVDIRDWYADIGTFPKKPIEMGISL